MGERQADCRQVPPLRGARAGENLGPRPLGLGEERPLMFMGATGDVPQRNDAGDPTGKNLRAGPLRSHRHAHPATLARKYPPRRVRCRGRGLSAFSRGGVFLWALRGEVF